jgi:hypothetical protein
MKLKLVSMMALGLLATAVACTTTNNDDDDDGGGGSGGDGSGASGSTSVTKAASTSPSSSSSGLQSCDDLPCDDATPDMDPNNDCFSCAQAGDPGMFSDGGACAGAVTTCLGTDENCTGGNPACCALNDCIGTCPQTPDSAFWTCVCGTMDAASCDPAMAAAGSCFGDNAAGVDDFFAVISCIYDDTCPTACAQ